MLYTRAGPSRLRRETSLYFHIRPDCILSRFKIGHLSLPTNIRPLISERVSFYLFPVVFVYIHHILLDYFLIFAI